MIERTAGSCGILDFTIYNTLPYRKENIPFLVSELLQQLAEISATTIDINVVIFLRSVEQKIILSFAEEMIQEVLC
jgi:hypothetical protein